jgi:hypothetical protein
VPHVGATEELGMVGYVAPVARPSARNLTATPPATPRRRVPRSYVHKTPRTVPAAVFACPRTDAAIARFRVALSGIDAVLARWTQEGMVAV